MFIGEYQHSLDSKNRIIVPAKLREGLGYPLEEWKILEDKLKTLPLTNKDARTFVRFFFSGACEVELDKQFRGLIPQNLKEYAKIEKDIVSIGVLSRVEIWSKEMWENYNDLNVDFDYIAEKMNDLGI